MCRFDKSKGKLLTISCQNMSLKNYFPHTDTPPHTELQFRKSFDCGRAEFFKSQSKLLNSRETDATI